MSGEVAERDITEVRNFITDIGLKNSSAKIFPKNTVLVAMYGATAGQVGILRIEAATNQAICGIYPNENLCPEFLYYALLYRQSDLIATAAGNAQPNISQIKIKNTEIPYPSLTEQKRIVAILDEAFAGIEKAIANTEKNLANARELFESYLHTAFSAKGIDWVETTVGEMADHCLGKMLDKNKNKGICRPYLRNLNVQWFNVDTNDLIEMKIEPKEEARYRVEKGDLLICEGGYPGRAAIWENDEPIYFQKAIHRVRCHESIYNRWLMYFLYLSDATKDLQKYFTGAGIQHFTGKALKKFKIPTPPLQEAKKYLMQFNELHEEIHHLESIYQQKLTALAELKQSLLQKAFSGELTANANNKLKEAAA